VEKMSQTEKLHAEKLHDVKYIEKKKKTSSVAKKFVWMFFRFMLLLGISFVILFPFISYISSSLMSDADLIDKTVMFIPRTPTFENFRFVIRNTNYFEALRNTSLISLMSAVLQTVTCMLVGYGIARFKFRGRQLIFIFVVMTMMIPPQTILIPLYMNFRFFNFMGLFTGLNLMDTFWPLFILSITGLGFKNGLFIFVFRQFFKGVPEELEEAAYVDGASVSKTFLKIMVPISIPIITTVFLFVISWQWTDTFYSDIFFGRVKVLSSTIFSLEHGPEYGYYAGTMKSSVIINTASLLLLTPLILVYTLAQKKLIQGIERSGIVG